MSEDPSVTGDTFDALARFFVDDGALGDTLQRIAELACRAGPADMAGITMLVEGKPRTGVFTDPEAVEIDEAQYDTGRGPCLDALRHQAVFRIDSTSDEDRWPDFARMAERHGVRSTLSAPITARGESLGALNLYSRRPAAFDPESAERMTGFAGHAAIVLVNSQVYWDARELNENLAEAMRSRAVIDYAIGILMARGGRTPDEAFLLLVRASQRENRKLREVASEIVDRTLARRRGD